MLAVPLRQPKPRTPPKPHQGRCLGDPDPAIHQTVQHAHPVDLRPAHRNHRHRPNTPHTKLRRVTSLSGATVTSLSRGYKNISMIECYVIFGVIPAASFGVLFGHGVTTQHREAHRAGF